MNSEEYEKLNNLIALLNNSEIIKNVLEAEDAIKEDKSLLELIKTSNGVLDKNILNNNKVTALKHYETNLNLLIWEINNHLKQLKEETSCALSVGNTKEEN
ncbi:MAG: hypothetical protein RSE91_03955 [Bacilli bacterium]